MFAIPIGIAAPVVFGLARDSGQSLFAPALAIIALAMALGGLVVYLARRVLEPAEQLERTRVILEDAYDRARAESLRDALTGLGNHRGFQEEYERQWLIARRHGTPLALAMIDLDDFKRVNDQGGHSNGDRCLTALRADADRPAAPDRPSVPGGRRRVRDPPAPVRHRWRVHDDPATAGRIPRGARPDTRSSRSISFTGRHQRRSRSCRRPRDDVPPGRCGPVLGQAARPNDRRDLRRRAP